MQCSAVQCSAVQYDGHSGPRVRESVLPAPTMSRRAGGPPCPDPSHPSSSSRLRSGKRFGQGWFFALLFILSIILPHHPPAGEPQGGPQGGVRVPSHPAVGRAFVRTEEGLHRPGPQRSNARKEEEEAQDQQDDQHPGYSAPGAQKVRSNHRPSAEGTVAKTFRTGKRKSIFVYISSPLAIVAAWPAEQDDPEEVGLPARAAKGQVSRSLESRTCRLLGSPSQSWACRNSL